MYEFGTKIFDAGGMNAGVGTRATYKLVASSGTRSGRSADVSPAGLSSSLGVCAALSALWLEKMQSAAPRQAVPSQARALIIYAKCVNHYYSSATATLEDFDRQVLGESGLNVESCSLRTAAEAIDAMSASIGAYYIDLGAHAVAAIKSAEGFYFFDPNEGAFEIKALNDFARLKDELLAAYPPAANWRLIQVAH